MDTQRRNGTDMEQSVDKRLKAIEILRKWVDVRIDKVNYGEAHLYLIGGEENEKIELFLSYNDAELLRKVLN